MATPPRRAAIDERQQVVSYDMQDENVQNFKLSNNGTSCELREMVLAKYVPVLLLWNRKRRVFCSQEIFQGLELISLILRLCEIKVRIQLVGR